MRITPLALCFTFAASLAHADESSFQWPHGAGAAVCLTYDDSLASQIDVAYPQLEAAGLKGTFFLQGNGGTMESRVEDWRQIAKSGHELASHSLMHPCRKGLPGRDWVADKYDLDQYNLERLESEMEVTNILLHAIDGQTNRTFAYPCGDTAVSNGTQPFLEFAREFFVASRGVSPELASMRDFKFSDTPAFSPDTKTFEECVAYLEDCYAKGTVAIFLNHGVGGDYLVTDAKLHEQILEFLADNQDRFWIDTFKNVTLHAKSEFERLDWPIE